MDIIEKFLLDKLELAFNEAKSSNYNTHISPKLSQLDKDFTKLKSKITEAGATSSPIVKEKLYSLSNLMLLLKNSHHLNSLTNRRLVNNLLMEIKEKLETTANREKGGDVIIKASKIYWWSTRLNDSTVKIYGLEDRSMERLLVRTESKDGLKAIGIVGMAGVGKTAVCQVLFDNRLVKKHFFPRIWVCLSKQPKDDGDYQNEVVKRILRCLGFEDEVIDQVGGEGGTRGLLFALRQQLKGKRYLIVLDDALDSDEFWCLSARVNEDEGMLSYGLPRGEGGAVIVTSRWRKTAENIVGEKNLNYLLPLGDDESGGEIFMGVLKKDGTPVHDNNKEVLKDAVMTKCRGLPLAAKMMGQIVHEKKENGKENQRNGSRVGMSKGEA